MAGKEGVPTPIKRRPNFTAIYAPTDAFEVAARILEVVEGVEYSDSRDARREAKLARKWLARNYPHILTVPKTAGPSNA
jgi:hypothetical protein